MDLCNFWTGVWLHDSWYFSSTNYSSDRLHRLHASLVLIFITVSAEIVNCHRLQISRTCFIHSFIHSWQFVERTMSRMSNQRRMSAREIKSATNGVLTVLKLLRGLSTQHNCSISSVVCSFKATSSVFADCWSCALQLHWKPDSPTVLQNGKEVLHNRLQVAHYLDSFYWQVGSGTIQQWGHFILCPPFQKVRGPCPLPPRVAPLR